MPRRSPGSSWTGFGRISANSPSCFVFESGCSEKMLGHSFQRVHQLAGSLVAQCDKSLKLARRGVTRDLVDNADADLGIRQPVPPQ
jgi:hypothetical protein